MLIRCPDCQFEREVNETKIPPTAQLATCPKCKNKFRFRECVVDGPAATLADLPPITEPETPVQPVAADPKPIPEPVVSETKPEPEPAAYTVPEQPVDEQSAYEKSAEQDVMEEPSSPMSESAESPSEEPVSGPMSEPEPAILSEPEPVAQGPEASTEEPAPVEEESIYQPQEQDAAPQFPEEEPYVQPDAEQTYAPLNISEATEQQPHVQKPQQEQIHQPAAPKKDGDIWDAIAAMGDGDRVVDDGWTPHRKLAYAQIPWENILTLGVVRGFGQTIKEAAFTPSNFFPRLQATASAFPAVVFIIIMGLLSTVLDVGWFALSLDYLRSSLPPQFAGMLQDGLTMSGVASSFGSTIGWIGFKLIFMAAVYHGLLRLLTGRPCPFSTTVRVLGYSSASSVASIVPYFGPVIGIVWFCILSVIGTKHAHNITWKQTVLALTPFYLLCFALIAFAVRVILMASGGGA